MQHQKIFQLTMMKDSDSEDQELARHGIDTTQFQIMISLKKGNFRNQLKASCHSNISLLMTSWWQSWVKWVKNNRKIKIFGNYFRLLSVAVLGVAVLGSSERFFSVQSATRKIKQVLKIFSLHWLVVNSSEKQSMVRFTRISSWDRRYNSFNIF